VLAALLVPFAAGESTPRRAGALLAGAAFTGSLAAVHPLHSEPVSAIYGRPDLLAALFALAFLNLAVRGRSVTAAISLALALLSKESAVALPLLAPIALAAGVTRRTPRVTFGRAAALASAISLAVLGGYLYLRGRAVGLAIDPRSISPLDNPLVTADGIGRWLTPIAVLGRYAALWFHPAVLCADHGFDTVPIVTAISDPYFLGGAALLGAGLAAIALLAAHRSPLALALAAAGLTWLPASSAFILAPALMAERFVYLPSILVCVALGGVYARLTAGPLSAEGGGRARLLARASLHAAAAIVVVAAAARTWDRASEFHDDLTLYRSGAAACPRSAKTQYNLGNALARERKDLEAIAAFKEAVSIAPWLAVAHNNMGMSYAFLGRFREAEEAFREAARQEPGLISPHQSLAGLLYQDGRLEAALEEARIALSLSPPPDDADRIQELIRQIERRLAPPS
jgi:tetratricopeptide (TPR) repeat protein